MNREQTRGIFCNPTLSFDGRGRFYNLGDYNDIDVHFVDEKNGIVEIDEEQGFEAVLDISNLGKGLWDFDLTQSDSNHDAQHGPLYQKEQLNVILQDKTLNSTAKRDAAFKSLEAMGIKTFIVVSGKEDNTSEILQRVRDVIDFVSILKRSHGASLRCCLLFQDTDGLLYNLIVPHHASGPFSQLQSKMSEFSSIQATATITILARVFPCISAGQMDSTNPAFLALILGLALTEEMTHSWLTSSLLVQGMPSISSYQLLNNNGHDWIYKAVLTCFIFSGVTSGETRRVLLTVGVSLACTAMLANLGSRAWYNSHMSPISLCGPLAPVISFAGAVSAGIFLPHMGHHDIEAGGKPAIESIVRNALFVCAFFGVTAYNGIQKIFLSGTEGYNQNLVNITIGSWIFVTLVVNLVLAALMKPGIKLEDTKELLLFEDQYSPVGFRVPTFPAFVINPAHAKKGLPWIQFDHELYLSVFVALLMMGSMVSMAFTGWHKNLESQLVDLISNL